MINLILERVLKMNHNGYFAVKLDESSQDVVKRNATMEVVRVDHIHLHINLKNGFLTDLQN